MLDTEITQEDDFLIKNRIKKKLGIKGNNPDFEDAMQEARIKVLEIKKKFTPEMGEWGGYASVCIDRKLKEWNKVRRRNGATNVMDHYLTFKRHGEELKGKIEKEVGNSIIQRRNRSSKEPIDEIISKEIIEIIRKEIESIPNITQKQVIQMFLDGKFGLEINKELSLTKKGAYYQFEKAKAYLKKSELLKQLIGAEK